jgi:hypothetical protein
MDRKAFNQTMERIRLRRTAVLASLGLMRASPAVVATVVALLVGCGPVADDPKVNAPISPEDVQEVCALVRAETSEPISQISEVTTEAYTPGVTPRQVVVTSANGERHETTQYLCPDRVWVFTRPAQGSPLWFDIHKKDNKWAIVKTERMTNR